MTVANDLVEHLANHTLASKDDCKMTLASVLAGYPVLLEGLPGVENRFGARRGRSAQPEHATIAMHPRCSTGGYHRLSAPGSKRGKLVFVEGPVFTPCLLVDEINRANPRSQSALLEAMAEGTVTVEGQTQSLPPERVILATQNPQDQVGTQALPESQLDRFGVVLELGYPSSDKERAVMARQFEAAPNAPHLDLMQARQALQQVAGFDDALSYLSRVVEASRAEMVSGMAFPPVEHWCWQTWLEHSLGLRVGIT